MVMVLVANQRRKTMQWAKVSNVFDAGVRVIKSKIVQIDALLL
jgi:hypothetical protein